MKCFFVKDPVHCAVQVLSTICANEWTEDKLKDYSVRMNIPWETVVDKEGGISLCLMEKIMNEAGNLNFYLEE